VKKADNTGVNARDRAEDALTASDQGGSESDREISRTIRKGIMAKDDLSTTAKNIKIITQEGKVTLRGPVNTESEQKTIAEIAQGVAGVTSVDNQLEVKTNQ
jgi:osmotically-inducible protein OsmY